MAEEKLVSIRLPEDVIDAIDALREGLAERLGLHRITREQACAHLLKVTLANGAAAAARKKAG